MDPEPTPIRMAKYPVEYPVTSWRVMMKTPRGDESPAAWLRKNPSRERYIRALMMALASVSQQEAAAATGSALSTLAAMREHWAAGELTEFAADASLDWYQNKGRITVAVLELAHLWDSLDSAALVFNVPTKFLVGGALQLLRAISPAEAKAAEVAALEDAFKAAGFGDAEGT